MVKPSELVHSVHAYLVEASFAKAAKALKKEAMLGSQETPDALVDLVAATATWSKKQVKKGQEGASEADVPRSVLSFLSTCQLVKSAKALKKEAAVSGDAPLAPLLEAAELHLKKAKKAAAKAAPAEPPAISAAAKQETKKEKKGKKAKGSVGAAAPALSSETATAKTPGAEESEKKKKKAKKRKRSASEDLRQEEARNTAEKKKRDEAADAMNAWLAKTELTPKTAKSPKTPGSARTPGTPFERIDSEKWMAKIEDERLKDNSYEGTYGDGGWGARASQKLVQVRGKDFRHEKTKKKRGGYRGGAVDLGSNSIKFADSDDDD